MKPLNDVCTRTDPLRRWPPLSMASISSSSSASSASGCSTYSWPPSSGLNLQQQSIDSGASIQHHRHRGADILCVNTFTSNLHTRQCALSSFRVVQPMLSTNPLQTTVLPSGCFTLWQECSIL